MTHGLDKMQFGAGQQLYSRARRRIPGGTQLLSKRPEMFLPEGWPSYFSRAAGVEVWDLDGKRYIDMSHNAVGSCVLGIADPDVDGAVLEAIAKGVMSTLNCPEEVELADLLCELHPWAEQVRYARTGGEASAIAVRIARAKTGRDRVAFCGYHGWHDWYLSANLGESNALDGHLLPGLMPAGVPRGLRGTALPFRYNHIAEFEEIVQKYRDELAAVIIEPIRNHYPAPGFLESIKEITSEIGAVLIFDEITAAFRLTTGGAHLRFGVHPDIAVLAKAMSNGYPMAAVIGISAVMEAAQNTFISSTYWTDRIGPAAAIATIHKHQRLNVADRLMELGCCVQKGWCDAAAEADLPIEIGGIPPLSHFSIGGDQAPIANTLMVQLMLDLGFLASKNFYPTNAHRDEHVAAYLAAIRDVFTQIADAIRNGTAQAQLKGPIAQSAFSRLT